MCSVPSAPQQHDVGEGAADVDADAKAASTSSAPGSAWTCRVHQPRLHRGRRAVQPRAPRSSRAQPRASLPHRRPARRVDHHAVVGARGRGRLTNSLRTSRSTRHRVALQRVAPAAGARDLVAEHVAAPDRHGELGGQDAVLAVRVEQVQRRPARPAAIQAVGRDARRSERTWSTPPPRGTGSRAGTARRPETCPAPPCRARTRRPRSGSAARPRSPRPSARPCWRTCWSCRPGRRPTAGRPRRRR